MHSAIQTVIDREHTRASYNRAFTTGIVLNIGFVAVEAFYGWHAGSLALLADAGHNLSDVAGLALAWAGSLAGRFAPDTRHTYGWRRASVMAAFTNAILVLLAMGSLAWESIARLNTPATTEGWTIIAVAAMGIVVKGITALLFTPGRSIDLNIRGAFMHMIADALVAIGVGIAGALYLVTGWAWLDPATSLGVALIVAIGTWSLFKQSLHLMFDGVPESIDLAAVQGYLLSQPQVAGIHDLHVWAMSTSDFALTAHLVMPAGHPGDAWFKALDKELHDRYGIAHSTIQIDLAPLRHGCATTT